MTKQLRDRTWRWPSLVVFTLLATAAVIVARQPTDTVGTAGAADAFGVPMATDASSPRSTWYCAGTPSRGDARPEAGVVASEHVLVIANTTSTTRRVTVTGFPADGGTGVVHLDLPGNTVQDVPVSMAGVPAASSALVEADGGLVTVAHTLRGTSGRSTTPCASSTGTTWYFPVGTTRLGAHQQFSIFNPFPDDAVVDFTFQTDEGLRESDKLRGIVVPPRRTVLVSITDTITVRNQVATTVHVRSGRAVVDELLSTDGSNGTPRTLTVVPGAQVPSGAWFFADDPAIAAGVEQQLVVYNPTREPVEAEVQLGLDDEAPGEGVPPFELRIRPGQYSVVELGQQSRVPSGAGSWALVSVRSGPGVVAARSVRTSAAVTVTLGSPVIAPNWQLPAGVQRGAASRLAIVNPSPADSVRLTVRVVRDGRVETLPGFDGVTLAARARTTLELPDALPARTAVVVEASASVVVEQRVVFEAEGASSFMGIPVVTGATAPGPDALTPPDDSQTPGTVDIETLGSIPGTVAPPGGSVPPGSTPPGSDPPPAAPDPAATSSTTAPAAPG